MRSDLRLRPGKVANGIKASNRMPFTNTIFEIFVNL